MLNCEVLIRDENGTPSPFCDIYIWQLLIPRSHGRRLYRRDHGRPPQVYQMVSPLSLSLLVAPKTDLTLPSSLYVYNKIDCISMEFLDQLAHEDHTVVMSCELDLGIGDVVDRAWKELNLMRIYTKRKGVEPNFSEALIVRQDSTVEDVCDQVHRTLKESFKYALVWGASARHVPQRVGLGHVVADEDVITIVTK